MIRTVLIMMMTLAKCLNGQKISTAAQILNDEIYVHSSNTIKCGVKSAVCIPDDASIPKGYLATEPCGEKSTCYLKTYEVSFGPFGNLPTATRQFSDRILYERNGFIQKIRIFVGDFAGTNNIITGIQVTYGSVEGPMHGGPGNKTPINCTPKKNGLFFGGVYGRARTHGTFDSFIYLLGFTETITRDNLCVGGTGNQMVPSFNIQAPTSTTYTLAYISGTQSLGKEAMLGGLRFHFLSVSP